MRSDRTAVRIILLDTRSRVLLFEGRDLSDLSDQVRFWFTAGGGVEDGESLEEAVVRELHEETGQTDLQIAGPFHRREVDFLDHGEPQHQIEYFFAARTRDSTLSNRDWTELERSVVTMWRWWTTVDLQTTSVQYFPDDLVQLVHQADTLV